MSAGDSLSPQQFFHGTGQEFQPGDVLRPASEIGKANHAYIADPSRAEYVYSHRHMRAAGDYAVNAALTAGGGFHDARVYRVEPVGEHEPDEHEPYGFKSRTARVVEEVPYRRWRRSRSTYIPDES